MHARIPGLALHLPLPAPALANAGYQAVAPFNRGFAPTELPDDRHPIHFSTMVADQIALHEALGGATLLEQVIEPTGGGRLLRRAEFTSRQNLPDRIENFTIIYNPTAKPYRWTYDGRPLKIT